ncbi:hypothetical protein [Paraburkholderia gardini]|nr:hypothetical protein [Paraburkholderia gardini]
MANKKADGTRAFLPILLNPISFHAGKLMRAIILAAGLGLRLQRPLEHAA